MKCSSYRKSNRYRGLCHCGGHAWAVLTKGFVTLVSPDHAFFLKRMRWHAEGNGQLIYAVSSVGEKNVRLHACITGADETDHQDHNGLNNQSDNLRPCTRSQNIGNSRHARGVSGFRGVYLEKQSGRWRANISRQKLGLFDTPEEAARAYDAAAIARFGEFATTNFPASEESPR